MIALSVAKLKMFLPESFFFSLFRSYFKFYFKFLEFKEFNKTIIIPFALVGYETLSET